MSFFKSLLGNESSLGVDIGTASIKIAEIASNKGELRLVNYGILETYGYLERFNEALQSSNLNLSEANTADYLKLLVERSNIRTRTAVASLPAFLAFSTLLEVPPMSEGEIKKFLEFQAAQYVPLPLTSVTIDWVKVGERTEPGGGEKYQLFLVSIPNETIELYRKIFKRAGLDLQGVELEGMGLARALTANAKEPALIMDIGSRSSSFSVAAEGLLKFSGQTDFSGASLTQTIAKGLGISDRRAEDLKKLRGLMGYGGEHELSTLIQPFLDVIMGEAKRIVRNFENAYGGKIANVILSGGGANLLGFEEYAAGQFGIPAAKANPFPGLLYPESVKPLEKDIGPLLSLAIGVGMKSFL